MSLNYSFYIPDIAVKKTNPLAAIASPTNFLVTNPVTVTGRRIRNEFVKRNEYNTNAKPRWEANLYCDTLGTSEGLSNLFSRPDLTIYQPIKP